MLVAGGCQRRQLPLADRLLVAHAAARLPALADRLQLFPAMAAARPAVGLAGNSDQPLAANEIVSATGPGLLREPVRPANGSQSGIENRKDNLTLRT